jgi:hypothetical protein
MIAGGDEKPFHVGDEALGFEKGFDFRLGE